MVCDLRAIYQAYAYGHKPWSAGFLDEKLGGRNINFTKFESFSNFIDDCILSHKLRNFWS